ncbi:MAG: exodeoxyribonuclease VII large subunit [Ilumatobacteraceae bacterium]|nr:exodeoxyribonuclease VII large subunit [Ilumatobacteraceae bacterium]
MSSEMIDGRPVFTVSAFGNIIKGLVSEAFLGGVWVEGEIQGAKPAKPHMYFSLAEKVDDVDVKIDVAIFAGALRGVNAKLREHGIEIKNGMKVRVFGVLDFYAPRGSLTFKVSDIDTRFSLGELALQREALLRKLIENGMTELNKALEVPIVPLRLGVISSETAAGWADARKHFEESGFGFQISFVDCRVQGDQAVSMVVRALKILGARTDIDVILLMRGGGSKGDLAAFDDEAIALAIARCPLPVFTGIGHEVDRSIADEVAHTACKTPTACADEIIGYVAEFLEAIADAAHDLQRQTQQVLERSRTRLTVNLDRLCRVPVLQLERHAQRLDGITERVRLLDPVNTMAKGWSITRAANGDIVRDAASLSVGQEMTTTFASGSATSTIKETHI